MHNVVASQYGASLAMLRRTIDQCPQALWYATSYRNAAWHIAYHVLFYTHLYIMPTEQNFTPWTHHREAYHDLSVNPTTGAYTKEQVLAYHDHVAATIARVLPTLDLSAGESGFHWLPFGKLELQFYNIRHLQQHTGELCERIFVAAQAEVEWIGQQALPTANTT